MIAVKKGRVMKKNGMQPINNKTHYMTKTPNSLTYIVVLKQEQRLFLFF